MMIDDVQVQARIQIENLSDASVKFYRGFPIFINKKTCLVTVMDPKKRFKPVRKFRSVNAATTWIEEVSEVK